MFPVMEICASFAALKALLWATASLLSSMGNLIRLSVRELYRPNHMPEHRGPLLQAVVSPGWLWALEISMAFGE